MMQIYSCIINYRNVFTFYKYYRYLLFFNKCKKFNNIIINLLKYNNQFNKFSIISQFLMKIYTLKIFLFKFIILKFKLNNKIL